MAPHSAIEIREETDVTRARRHARVVGERLGWGEADVTRLQTIVSELTRNIVKYAGSGTCEFEADVRVMPAAVKVTCRDQGPGIADIDQAMADGYSAGRTLGIGLPGARRLADSFDISSNGSGTIVSLEVRGRVSANPGGQGRARGAPPAGRDAQVFGVAIRPMSHGRYCGDQAQVWRGAETITACIVDGLGHGAPAQQAAQAAIAFIEERQADDLGELLLACNRELEGTRGAAMAVARIDVRAAQLSYAAVGNTRCAVYGPSVTYLGGIYGIVGDGASRPNVETRQLNRRDVIAFWTDGLPEILPTASSRARRARNAQALAEELLQRYAIQADDAAVVVVRWDL